jgi:hypothetical protein
MVHQQIRFMEMAHHCCNNWTVCQNFCCVSSSLRSLRHIATVASAHTSHHPVVTNVSSPLQRRLHITSHHLMVLMFYLFYVSRYGFAGHKCSIVLHFSGRRDNSQYASIATGIVWRHRCSSCGSLMPSLSTSSPILSRLKARSTVSSAFLAPSLNLFFFTIIAHKSLNLAIPSALHPPYKH